MPTPIIVLKTNASRYNLERSSILFITSRCSRALKSVVAKRIALTTNKGEYIRNSLSTGGDKQTPSTLEKVGWPILKWGPD